MTGFDPFVLFSDKFLVCGVSIAIPLINGGLFCAEFVFFAAD